MAIYLIRHGETALNASRVMQVPETPLSEVGLDQAARLGARLADVGIGRILASDYARASMTADAVQRATGVALDHTPLLRERNFGDLRGRAYSSFDFDPFAREFEPPGGESWPVFEDRVDRAWTEATATASQTEGHLAVVTHGLVKASIAARLVDLGEATHDETGGWRNTSVTILEPGSDGRWRVQLLGCAAHLD